MQAAGDGGEAGSSGPGLEAGVNGGCGLRQYFYNFLRSICGPTICGFYDRHKGKGFLTSHFSSDLNSVFKSVIQKQVILPYLPMLQGLPLGFDIK